MIWQFRRHAAITAALAVITLCVPAIRAQNTPDASSLMADQFVNDAQSVGRNVKIPSDLAANEALTLLEEAVRLDPSSTTALRLLAEAAGVTGDVKIQQSSLLDLSKLQPDNLVVQVQFMDALAAARQTVADRIAVYQAALNNTNLDPQVQSAMALRIGRLLAQQGRTVEASDMYIKAVGLNSANLAAWQELAHALGVQQAPAKDRLYALLQLLHCDPYQPEALAAVAGILASANDFKQAANWANAAIEQFQQSGVPLDPTLAADLAADWAIAGQENLLNPYLKELLGLKQPQLQVLMIALTDRSNGSFAVDDQAKDLLGQLHDRIAAMILANPAQQSNLEADDIWLDLFYNPTLPSDMDYRISQLGTKTKISDPILYQRLEGWLLLRQGHLDAASEQFSAAGSDPYSLLGLARIATINHDKDTAGKILQQLWDAHPGTIMALDTAQEARVLGLTLTQTPDEQASSAAAAAYPAQLLNAADDSSSVVLVTAQLENQFCALGDPIYIDVQYVNTSPYSLAVGPGTGITTDVALAASSNGLSNTDLGAYAVDSDPQVLRLDPNSNMTIQYRVDQGILRELLFNNPTSFFSGQLQIITNPLMTGTQLTAGLGGQEINAEFFNVQGYCSNDPSVLQQTIKSLPTLPTNNQMLAIGSLASVLPGLTSLDSATPDQQTLMNDIAQAIVSLTSNSSMSLPQAWLVRHAPLMGLPDNVTSAINNLIQSPDPSVRMVSYWRLLAAASSGNDADNDADQIHSIGDRLSALAKLDKDPVASTYARELSEQAYLPTPAATPPAQQ
jgi:tetratricopeptide (TPR) repeat protein